MAKHRIPQNSTSIKKCAFCKHWYDPNNSVISPVRGAAGLWEYEDGIKKDCIRYKAIPRPSNSSCQYFESKI